jgi:nicotinamidase-related amidase
MIPAVSITIVEGDASVSDALVVVDMQEYFCRTDSALARWVGALGGIAADGWYYATLTDTVVPNIGRLLADFRSRGRPVLFTEFGSRTPDGDDLPGWAKRHNELAVALIGERCYPPLTDPSARVIAELAPAPSDRIVQKTTSGPLAGTSIDQELRSLGVRRVVVTGVATDVCVTGMARELADSDFDTTVVRDACATPSRASHEAALLSIATFSEIAETADLLSPAGAGR